MRIVNREEFLKLPKYTLFCLYDKDEVNDCDRIGALKIKHESLESVDWIECYTTEVWFEEEMEDVKQWDKALRGESVKMDMVRGGIDAMYVQHQLFMIYEVYDLVQLKNIIDLAIYAI